MSGITSLHVVDLTGNLGGGTRFVRALLPALQELRPGLRITLSGTPTSVAQHASADLVKAGIHVRSLSMYVGMNWYSKTFRERARYRWRLLRGLEPERGAYVSQEFCREIDGSDVVYVPWPYGLRAPKIRSPLVTTVHDLNFRHFFGTPIFSREQCSSLDEDVTSWVGAASVIVSSEFMAQEMAAFYPDATVEVVRLPPFADPDSTAEVGASLPAGVRQPYVLSANNVTVHKNLGAVFAAHALLRERFPELQLVLAGLGTDAATGRADPIGFTAPGMPADVLGLGYVSDQQILALIDKAEVVINSSLYEAGNGPGLDAWRRGVPVAMSDIPPFAEHLSSLGVEASLFNPRDPVDIAAKLRDVLDNPERWAAAAARSREALATHTWSVAAEKYLAVFDRAFAHARG